MPSLNANGMTLADGVVETVISLAVQNIEGVTAVGTSPVGGILSAVRNKPSTQGIEITPLEDGSIAVVVHIAVQFGVVMPELADKIREAIVDAVLTQVGMTVSAVDVDIDAISFE